MALSIARSYQLVVQAVIESSGNAGPAGFTNDLAAVRYASNPDDPVQAPISTLDHISGLQLLVFYSFATVGFDKDILWTAINVRWKQATGSANDLGEPASLSIQTTLVQLATFLALQP
jgi:hypothetical protein